MTFPPPSSAGAESRLADRDLAVGLALIGAIFAIRLASLLLADVELGPDEAQYWRWSDDFAWGYFSKPPLVAWAIGATTALFGDSEAAVRLAACIAHAFGAAFLMLAARRLFSGAAGWVAALVYSLAPGVSLSAGIISTDALLLPLISLALWMAAELRGGLSGPARWIAGVTLGTALGLGFLAKYAAIYALVGFAIAMVLDAPLRRALLSGPGGLALFAFAGWIAPNMLWNAENSFATLDHTADNASWSFDTLNPENLASFLADQLGVFGPVAMAALVLCALGRGRSPAPHLWLWAFVAPPLIAIAFQELVSRAHANWAAAAYPAASLIVANWLAAPALRKAWLSVLIALQGGAALMLYVLTTFQSLAAPMGMAHAFKRVSGWSESARVLHAEADAIGATALLVDEREVFHGVDYYSERLGLTQIPLRMWRRFDAAKSFAEDRYGLQPGEDETVLVASFRRDFRPRIAADFAEIEPIGRVAIPIGGGRTRDYVLYRASGFAPVSRTPAYEAEMDALAANEPR